MKKIVKLGETIYEITRRYPDIVVILSSLGFKHITAPGMMTTVGRFVTLRRGADMRHIDISVIEKALREHGFAIEED